MDNIVCIASNGLQRAIVTNTILIFSKPVEASQAGDRAAQTNPDLGRIGIKDPCTIADEHNMKKAKDEDQILRSIPQN